MKKTLISAALALVLILTCLPLSVLAKTAAPSWTVPAGYNEHDYGKLAAFLEQTDENGVKNGEKLSENYDVNDPASWGTYEQYEWDDEGNYTIVDAPRFEWENYGEGGLRISWIYIQDVDYDPDWGLCGELDLSNCSFLIELNCTDNFITAVDVTGCDVLAAVNASYNLLTGIDVSDCPELGRLEVSGNQLTELDVSHNPGLQTLFCPENMIAELDVSACPMLATLVCYSNQLTELDVSHNPDISCLDCDDNMLTELDISHNPALEVFYCSANMLTELEVTANPLLYILNCYDNGLTELDLSNNPDMTELDVGMNALTELDVSGLAELTYLSCEGNLLTELDLLSNTELNAVNCFDNPLKNIALPDSPLFPMQVLRAEGNGAVGFSYSEWETFTAYAYQGPGAEFLGWYDDEGGFISYDSAFEASGLAVLELIARFEGGEIPGDMNGDGAVDISDALSILRAAMGLVTATPGQIAACDMDGDGMLTVADALQVMRMAMGLI